MGGWGALALRGTSKVSPSHASPGFVGSQHPPSHAAPQRIVKARHKRLSVHHGHAKRRGVELVVANAPAVRPSRSVPATLVARRHFQAHARVKLQRTADERARSLCTDGISQRGWVGVLMQKAVALSPAIWQRAQRWGFSVSVAATDPTRADDGTLRKPTMVHCSAVVAVSRRCRGGGGHQATHACRTTQPRTGCCRRTRSRAPRSGCRRPPAAGAALLPSCRRDTRLSSELSYPGVGRGGRRV